MLLTQKRVLLDFMTVLRKKKKIDFCQNKIDLLRPIVSFADISKA